MRSHSAVTLCVLFPFYRSVWAAGGSASPAAATCGQPGRPDLPLGCVWWKKPAFTSQGKPCCCQMIFAEKHMEKYFERHLVNQRSNCCPLKTKQPCSISLPGVEVVKRIPPKIHRWFHLMVVIWLCILMEHARACPCLEKECEIVAGRVRLLMVNVHELEFNLNK